MRRIERAHARSIIDQAALYDRLVRRGSEISPHVVQDGVNVCGVGPDRDAGLDFQDRICFRGQRPREGQRAREFSLGPHHAAKRRGRLRRRSAKVQKILDERGVGRPRVSDEVGTYGILRVRL